MAKNNDNSVTLDTQTPYLWIIFGREKSPLKEDFKHYYDKLLAWCKINAKLYAFIGHDKDIQEDGTPKFRHIHALIVLKDGDKPRLKTSLNRLSQVTGVDVADIDITKAESIEGCLRYNLHRGYPQKYQYDVSDMVTNLTEKELEPFLNTETQFITADYILKLIELCNYSVVSILKQIGLKNYLKYRNVIKDVIQEVTR